MNKNKQIVQEAAEWFVELNTGAPPDLSNRKRFDLWLRASPEHVRAFLEMIPVWEDGSRLPVDLNVTPEQLIEFSRAQANIVALPGKEAPQHQSDTFRTKFRVPVLRLRTVCVAFALAALLGTMLIGSYLARRYPVYATGDGEHRSLELADTSVVDLDSRSRIRVRYSDHERAIDLLDGQALFKVAKNIARPFVVYSGEAHVRAVGTQFNVYKNQNDILITVVEGRVAVYTSLEQTTRFVEHRAGDRSGSANANGVDSQIVSAGQRVTVSSTIVHEAERANLAQATAWTARQLVFDFTPLPEVAEEFNRYNSRRLSVDTANRADFRISGIFSSTDPVSLIRFLREQPGIRVIESEHEIRITRD